MKHSAIEKRDVSAKAKYVCNNWELYLFILPPLLIIILFYFVPINGIQIAFRDYNIYDGIWNSEWVGWDNFERFFSSHYFSSLIFNTISISLYYLVLNSIIPIAIALLLTQLENRRFRKLVQNVIYAPHFISVVVIVGMLAIFFSPSSGIVNSLRKTLNLTVIDYMAQPQYFRNLYVFSEVWQHAGWGTVLYIAALSSVNPELYEAATVDGCNKFQRMLYVDIPCLVPTIIRVLILNTGSVMNVGFEKVYLMQNTLNLSVSEILSTYVYKQGLLSTDFSFATTIGLFNSVTNCVLLLIVNSLARKVGDTSLW